MSRIVSFLTALLVAGCASTSPGGSPAATDRAAVPADSSVAATSAPPAVGDPLLDLVLTDVRTGTTFTLAELATDRPVLVETMAIWCTTCLGQQREVVRAHGLGEFHSVGIDVDPNERAADLAGYAEREGFDWPFVVADAQLVRLLTERFGFEVTNPPSTPTFVVSPAGGIRALEFGRVRSAEELIGELGQD
ncbi:MAG TPA: hypothetical protein VMM85_03240 [Methylomirabilota bacterium]|nr:hypothetical protein [Methylomirabilota bacterium]